jgi:hypothetical protein
MTIGFLYHRGTLTVGQSSKSFARCFRDNKKGCGNMRFSDILGIKRFLSNRARMYTLGAIITGILSLLVSVVTFYGQSTGSFVISIDPELGERGIQMADNLEFRFASERLFTDPVQDALDVTYAWLDLVGIKDSEGNFVDEVHGYVAYTFWLKNTGSETVDITHIMRIDDATRSLDAAIRILVIEDDIVYRLYQKPDVPDNEGNLPVYKDMPQSINFLSRNLVFSETIQNFKPGDVKKFSVVIYMEGQDPDTFHDPETKEGVLGGTIKASMFFKILDN